MHLADLRLYRRLTGGLWARYDGDWYQADHWVDGFPWFLCTLDGYIHYTADCIELREDRRILKTEVPIPVEENLVERLFRVIGQLTSDPAVRQRAIELVEACTARQLSTQELLLAERRLIDELKRVTQG